MKNRLQLLYNFMYVNLSKIHYYSFLYPINKLLFNEFGKNLKLLNQFLLHQDGLK